jgi:phage shock protein PspC (stress-responsive transcriptional regulator)
MDKTININLGGTLFQIDEEAYRMLRDYLQAIDLKFRNTPGGTETIEDIESRIAEILLSQKTIAGVITRENVEAMISIIGKPEDFGQIENEEPAVGYGSTQRKKMFRNPDDSVIGGVCGGIGTYLDTDPVWFRILFVVFAFMAGFGFLVYLALWISLPAAVSNSQKKEMYGSAYNQAIATGRQSNSYAGTSKVGNAFNEIFRAGGRVLYIFARVILIITGIALVLTGFLALLSFVMVFIFKYPGAFSTNAAGINISYIPEFLNYIVTQSLVPWIKALTLIVISLPLFVIIYFGVKMIFWFRAKDGVVLLSGLVLWVISAAVLSILLFNEGISFAETAKSISQSYFKSAPDTLYIIPGKKISDLSIDNEIILPDEEYDIYVSDTEKQVYIRANLDFSASEDNSAWISVKKRSAGRSRLDATEKAERLLYNYKISGDTLFADEFFTFPNNTKWSFDEVGITIHAPEGTVIYMDKTSERQFHSYEDDDFVPNPGNRFWLITEDGLDYIGSPD